MAKIYDTTGRILSDGYPELKIGSKLYRVDNRKSTFERMQAEMKAEGKRKTDERRSEADIILRCALGEEAALEVQALDLTMAGYMNLVIYIQAAILDTSFEDAEKRFREAGSAGM